MHAVIRKYTFDLKSIKSKVQDGFVSLHITRWIQPQTLPSDFFQNKTGIKKSVYLTLDLVKANLHLSKPEITANN